MNLLQDIRFGFRMLLRSPGFTAISVLTLIGIVCGLVLGGVMGLGLQSLMFGVSWNDPFTFVSVTLLFIAVAAMATYIPARRALSVDPMIALRYE